MLEDLLTTLEIQKPERRILVLGDLMADKYIWGDHLRMCKEAPVPVMRRVNEVYKLGAAANIASSIRQLGAEVYLCGIVGFDDAALSLRRAIAAAGIATGGLFPSETRPTTLKVRMMSQEYRQLLFRLDSESTTPLDEKEVASLRGYVETMLPEIDLLVLSDYRKGMFGVPSFSRWIVDEAGRCNVNTVVLGRPSSLVSFAGATTIVCMASDAREFMYLQGRGFATELDSMGKEMRKLLRCGSLTLVHEERGLWQWRADGERETVAPARRQRIDCLGLEEAVTSATAIAVALGMDPGDVLNLASLAAGVICSKAGYSPISLSELQRFTEIRQVEPFPV